MIKFKVKVKDVQFWKSGLGRKTTTVFTGRIVEDDPEHPNQRPAGLRIISEPVKDVRDDGATIETFGTIYTVVR